MVSHRITRNIAETHPTHGAATYLIILVIFILPISVFILILVVIVVVFAALLVFPAFVVVVVCLPVAKDQRQRKNKFIAALKRTKRPPSPIITPCLRFRISPGSE